MRRLLLFDIDLTLIASAGAGLRSLSAAVAHVLGRDFSDLHVVPDGKTDPCILQEALEKAGLGEHDNDAVRTRIFDTYATLLTDELAQTDARRRILPGVMPLLERLAADPRAALGLLTGNLERTGRLKLAAFGLDRYFPIGGFGSDDADRNRLGEIARRRAEVCYGCAFEPRATWIIGDTPLDIQAAHAMGARGLGVATGRNAPDALQAAGADAVLPDLSDTDAVVALLLSP